MRPTTITYPPEGIKPIGVIEFVHGMCEKRQRYADTLKYFNNKGFICAISDTRGHGENILTNEDLGYFGEDGYKGLVDDVHEFTMYLKREFPKLPLILIGHSMGSLIVRTYLKKNSREVDAVVISGSPSNRSFIKLGKAFLKFIALFRGWHYRSPMVEKMVNGPFEKPFAKEGIVNSWLSTDRHIVELYNSDPLCGFTFTLNGYYTLFSLVQQVYSKMGWTSKNPSLPVMFISGAEDPCRKNDNAFKKAVMHLKRCGYPNTYYKLYQDMRHELFNEKGKLEVYKDILKFLEIKGGIEIEVL
ncbi:alpha/beta fold hydrolase [uncultured Eubacterium sp.]|uniref:alpha/beta fold hydrolase n=1 Tax=uncultured Eubacterium sp. TaxID=165185 RepID=UPI00267133FF|nr:alpha/beta hydrolase [uncultured Eubacterium sp.]